MYRVECLAKGTNTVILWDTADTLERAQELEKIYSVGDSKLTYTKVFEVK
jgi:hypothetical protein